jgi:DNA-binding MarR family transcriptional regulator
VTKGTNAQASGQDPEAGSAGPEESPPVMPAAFLLSKVGFDVARHFHAGLAAIGLEPRQFALLNYVALGEGQSQQALGEALRVPASRMVSIVDDLEQRGLLERRRNPDDRRAHALYLTPAGEQVLAEGRRVAMENEERICAPLAPEEREQLVGLLRRLAADQDMPIGVHPAWSMPAPGERPTRSSD